MNKIIVDTTVLSKQIAELNKLKIYYLNQTNQFSKDKYRASYSLALKLAEVQNNYKVIASNIDKILKYLKEYVDDVKGIETSMSGQGGSIKISAAQSIVSSSFNLIQNFEISKKTYFKLQDYFFNENLSNHEFENISSSSSYLNDTSLDMFSQAIHYYLNDLEKNNFIIDFFDNLKGFFAQFSNDPLRKMIVNSLQESNVSISENDIYKIEESNSVVRAVLTNGCVINFDRKLTLLSITNSNGLAMSFDENKNFLRYFYRLDDGSIYDISSIVEEASYYGYSINVFEISQINRNKENEIDIFFKNGEMVRIIDGNIRVVSNGKYWLSFTSSGHINATYYLGKTNEDGSYNRIQLGAFYQSQFYGDQTDFKNNALELIQDSTIQSIIDKYYPEATIEQKEFLMYKINATGCGYIALVNSVFREYEGRELDFYNTFGFPMYSMDENGDIDYNFEYFVLSYYCYLWSSSSYSLEEILTGVTKDIQDGSISSDSEDPDWISTGLSQSRSSMFSYFMETYNEDVEIINSPIIYDNINDTLDSYYQLVSNGSEEIIINAARFDLISLDGGRDCTDVGGHAMLVLGVAESGDLIVSSWGRKFLFDISSCSQYEDSWSYVTGVNYE